jgi:uncharacterized protein YeaO (DUF488 family)
VTRHAHAVRARRVYDSPSPDDGVRILVDRLWPRGLAKADAHVDEWPKELTPSTALRRWYHGPDGEPEEFAHRYEAELTAPEAAQALEDIRARVAKGRQITLLTAAKDPTAGHVAVLTRLLTASR